MTLFGVKIMACPVGVLSTAITYVAATSVMIARATAATIAIMDVLFILDHSTTQRVLAGGVLGPIRPNIGTHRTARETLAD